MSKSDNDKFLYIILLIALLIRLPGIFDGLPAVYNSTEHFLARMALSMGAEKSIDPGFYIYPTFYTYILLILFGCIYLSGLLFGFFSDQYDFAVQFLTDPSIIYIISRSMNVLLSLLTIVIIYNFLIKRTNRTIARFAAMIVAVSFYLVKFSTFATTDTLLILFSMLSAIYLYKLPDSTFVKDYLYAGIFCGLAIAAKYNAGFLIVGLLFIVIQNWRHHRVKITTALGASMGGLLIGFFITNPLWLVYPERFYHGWQLISTQMYSMVSAERGIPFIWEITELIKHEWIIGIIFIVATLYLMFTGEKKHYPLIIVVLFTFFYVGTWTKKGIDYLFAIFPAWILLSSFFIDEIRRKYFQKKYYTMVVVLLILTPSLVSVIYQAALHLNLDTREKATAWIISNINKEQSVCYDNYHNDLGVFDIERYLSYGASADQLPEMIKERLIPLSTDSRQISFIPILVENTNNLSTAENAYEEIALQYRRRTLTELIESQTMYLITNSWYYNSYLTIDVDDYPSGIQQSIYDVQEFYRQLNQNYESFKVFSPGFWTPGPEIRIYDLRQQR